MIYKNFELYNVGELIPAEGGGYHLARVPSDVRECMSENGKGVAIAPASVEIRFVINSGTAKIRLRSNNKRKLVVAYGAIHRGAVPTADFYGPEETVVEIAPFDNLDTVNILTDECGYQFAPNVVRVILERYGHDVLVDVEGDVRPPLPEETPEKRFLIYGSSITHGAFSLSSNTAYCDILARKLDCDVYNLGFGGACMLEKEVCDYICEQGNDRNDRTWDFAVFELGTNTVNIIDEEEFSKRINYLLDTVARKNPGKPVFVTDLYIRRDDSKYNNAVDTRRNTVAAACRGRENVIYAPALTLLGVRGLSADGIHPNVDGMYELAENWYKVIKNNI